MQATLYGLADASCGLSGAAATLVGPTGASAGGQRAPGDDFLNSGRFLTSFRVLPPTRFSGNFALNQRLARSSGAEEALPAPSLTWTVAKGLREGSGKLSPTQAAIAQARPFSKFVAVK